MKTMMAAVALAIALPAAAHAQPANPGEKHEHADGKDCCCKSEKKMPCCEKMHGKHEEGAADPHAGHDMSGHQGHQQPQN
ncbi:hypothetical protein E2493_03885 [Sphingomonas parva]|uniref:Copper resistance protein CopB n=1 Tax=Sphingomonas parva TaxID=2555898 RepID=A0A4Y8ZWA0_9SPHN|nr:hypothetical protein [Sphingomonas parva]TFI59622.1 hypothetical protein E2493_03885 [Sphingomonas parva]